ncbi:MAG: hypothetical protein P8170_01700 [Gemmatimonadota bacterium]|jgi:hypothetical protein
MTQEPIDERRFTDEEIREILKLAVQKAPSREKPPSGSLVKSEGLSLTELKAIGEEVGIEPARLEDAARTVAARGIHRAASILGAPTVVDFERRVDGEVNPEDTPDVLSLIRRTMGTQGEVNEVHGSLEWSAKGDSGERYITLSSRDGHTAIRGSANLTNSAVLTYLPAGIVGLFTSLVGLIKFVQDGSQVGLVLCLLVVPILYPILRTIFSKIVGGESAKLQRAVDELARLTEGSEP